MAGAYTKYGVAGKRAAEALPMAAAKRFRPDHDDRSRLNLSSLYARKDGGGEPRVIIDTDPIGASYDFYLQCSPMSPYLGGESARSSAGGLGGDSVDISVRASNPATKKEGQRNAADGGRPTTSLPSDASRTLFVQGLPLDCTRREVSHLFRPFTGFEEVRLVRKEPRHPGGDPTVICFVDFVSPAHATAVIKALQGYKFDELDHHSACLRLQFARYPGARSGGGYR